MRQISLQNATAILLQNATDVYYKMRQVFYYKMRQFYYKMQQLLQNATFIANCDSTLNNFFIYITNYVINQYVRFSFLRWFHSLGTSEARVLKVLRDSQIPLVRKPQPLTLHSITPRNGQKRFKNLAANATRFLMCV